MQQLLSSAMLCALAVFSLTARVADAQIVDPTDISGLSLWLDGDDPDGNGVSGGALLVGGTTTWVDKSGGGNDAAQTVVTNQPTLSSGAAGIGGIPVVQFDGNNSFLENGAASYSARTAFLVFRVTADLASTDLGQLWGQYDSPSTNGGIHVAADGRASNSNGFSFDGDIEAGLTGSYGLNGATLTTSASNSNAQPWTQDAATIITVEFSTTRTLSEHYIGALIPDFPVTTHAYGGDIGEIIIYDGLLTAEQQRDVQEYLGAKWSINLVPVPEPSTWLMTMLAAGGLGLAVRRQRRTGE